MSSGWSTAPAARAGRLSTPVDTSLSLELGLAADTWSCLALQVRARQGDSMSRSVRQVH
jgi:hypothetical protein